MNVNLFKDLRDRSPKLVTLDEVVRFIREDGFVKDRTERHRYYLSQGMNKAASAEKLSCPCFSVATLFCGGKTMKDVCGWTGLGMVDVDDVDAEALPALSERVAADGHTLLVYRTISGCGLRILFRYESDVADQLDDKQRKLLYEAAFEMANGYYQSLLQVSPDPKCKTHTQVSGMAHDPEACYRPEAEPFVIDWSACIGQTKHQESQRKLLRSAVKAAHREITAQGVEFRPGSHNEYVMRMGYLLNVYGVDEEVAADWAVKQFSADYHDNIDGIIRSCYKHTEEHGKRRMTKKGASLSNEKRCASVEEIERFLDTQVMLRFNVIRRQCEVKWLNTPSASLVPLAEGQYCIDTPPRTGEVSVGRRGEVSSELENTPSASLVPLVEGQYCIDTPPRTGEVSVGRRGEVSSELQNTPSASLVPLAEGQLFASEVVDDGFSPITDRDENTLWCRMMKAQGSVRLQDIRNVLQSEYVPMFNPFEDYFYSLPPWDGEDHIGQLARTVHVKGSQEQFVEYFRKWLVGMLPTIFDPNVVNHEIMVFIGRQGNFKSTFFSLLLPPCLQSYFHIKMNSNNLTKDDMLKMCEFALICLEEIGEMQQLALDQQKALVTDKIISERAAYARNKEHRPHIASFCGTGNNPRFLTDITGNRRWLVFEVEDIDNPLQHPFNYTGIYSQAMALWKSGFCYWFEQQEINALNIRNVEFEVPNLEEELVLTYFRQPFEGCKASFMKVAEVLERINAGIRHPLSPTKLGIIMTQLGFPAVKRNGRRGYLVIERSTDEIQSSRRLEGYFDN